MIAIVGAGCGEADLITVRGARLLGQADVIVYAGGQVNPQLLGYAKSGCEIQSSAKLSPEQLLDLLSAAHFQGRNAVLLWGEKSLAGVMEPLRQRGIPFELVPGVPGFCGSLASLQAECPPPKGQPLIWLRLEQEALCWRQHIRDCASQDRAMAILLEAEQLDQLAEELRAYRPDTPAALCSQNCRPDEKPCRCTVGTIPQTAREKGMGQSILVLVGDFLGNSQGRLLGQPDPPEQWRYHRRKSEESMGR